MGALSPGNVAAGCKLERNRYDNRDREWATYTCVLGFHVYGERGAHRAAGPAGPGLLGGVQGRVSSGQQARPGGAALPGREGLPGTWRVGGRSSTRSPA